MGCSQSAQATATLSRKNSTKSEDLARSETAQSPLVSQDSEYLEDQMIDQFDDPMKFYTKSKTILKNVAPDGPDGQDDHLLVKQNSGDSECLPDPSSYDAESEVCKQDTDTPYNDPMDYDCDSDSGDFASVKLEAMNTDFPEPEGAEAPEADFPEADPSPENDSPEDEPEAAVLETAETPQSMPCEEPAFERQVTSTEEFSASEPESEDESAKPSPKKLKTKRRKPRGAGKSSPKLKRQQTLKRQKTTVKKSKGLKAPGRKLRKGKSKVTRRKKK